MQSESTSSSASSSSSSLLSPEDQRLIDQIAIKITDANPTVDYDSIKKTIETSALQSQKRGGDVQKILNGILQRVTMDGNGPVAKKFIDQAMKEKESDKAHVPADSNSSNAGNQKGNTLDTSLDELYEKATQLHDAGNYDEAITYYDKVLAIDPNDVYALGNKGGALFNLGKYDEAITYYDKVLVIDPNDVYALGNKGGALFNLGKYDEAITYSDKALAIDPNDIFALYYKGTFYSYNVL
ncbi:MAG: tetratricopeptide repeat protein [Candidatus Nitrosocosmicus sp.]